LRVVLKYPAAIAGQKKNASYRITDAQSQDACRLMKATTTTRIPRHRFVATRNLGVKPRYVPHIFVAYKGLLGHYSAQHIFGF